MDSVSHSIIHPRVDHSSCRLSACAWYTRDDSILDFPLGCPLAWHFKRAAHYPQLRRSQEFFWRQVEKSWKCVVCGGWTPSHAIERRRPPTQAFKRVFLTPGRKILKCVVCGAWTPSHAIERRRTPSNSIARQLSNWFDIWRQKRLRERQNRSVLQLALEVGVGVQAIANQVAFSS